jgi:AcrR family transcriptional regulator
VALKLVAERGFANVTIEDITEAADVSMRTFFNYFPSKESAVIGADPERIEQIRVGLLSRPIDETPLEALRAVILKDTATIDADLADLDEGREAWFRRLSIVRNDPELLGAYAAHISSLEQIFVVALADRIGTDPQTDPYPALLIATIMGATRIAALYWSANKSVVSLTALTRAAIDNLAEGLHDNKTFSLAPHLST